MGLDDRFDDVSYISCYNALNKFCGKNVLIYGAGSFGKEFFNLLQISGVRVSCFLDKRGSKDSYFCGIPILKAQDIRSAKVRKESVVFFAIVMDKKERSEVIDYLRELGYDRIEEAQYYRSLLVLPDESFHKDIKEYYLEKYEFIDQARSLFEEEKSRIIYETNINAHITRNYDYCFVLESPMYQQYLPEDIPLWRRHKRIIDCGAYYGDTVSAFLEKEGELDFLAAFEPDMDNYRKLTAFCRKKNKLLKKAIIVPAAVSKETGFSKFNSQEGSGKLENCGIDQVMAIALDDMLSGFSVDLIKMDIEGAEINALYGAEIIIRNSKPDLAICVYHNINHIWDIPLLLNSWNLGYHFYLRTYNAFTMETVLYATAF